MNYKQTPGRGRKFLFACVAALSIFSFTACEKSLSGTERDPEMLLHRNPPKTDQTIVEIAASNANFSELVEALTYVDAELGTSLVATLSGTDQYTVFAPTNDAFMKLYMTLGVEDVTEIDPNLVLQVLQYHVTEGRRAYNSVVPKNGMRTIETMLMDKTFSVDPAGMITAVGNMAKVTTPNISARNGIIHVIDTVLLPVTL